MIAKNIREWSSFVRLRDARCTCCGKESDLHAHHVKPKSLYPALKFDTDNGIALCYSCHKREHEVNRPVRVRSERPQKKTLILKVADLEARLDDAMKAIDELSKKLEDCQQELHDAEMEILMLQNRLRGK